MTILLFNAKYLIMRVLCVKSFTKPLLQFVMLIYIDIIVDLINKMNSKKASGYDINHQVKVACL